MDKGSQCYSIINLLKKGRASNVQLTRASGAKSLTRRISDLREKGYNIICTEKDNERGITWYELDSEKEPILRIRRTRIDCNSKLCRFNKKSLCSKRIIEMKMKDGTPICMEYTPVVKRRK